MASQKLLVLFCLFGMNYGCDNVLLSSVTDCARLFKDNDCRGEALAAEDRGPVTVMPPGGWNDVISSVTVRRGCTLTLYRNGNLADEIYEIQAPLTENISQRNLGSASDQTSSYSCFCPKFLQYNSFLNPYQNAYQNTAIINGQLQRAVQDPLTASIASPIQGALPPTPTLYNNNNPALNNFNNPALNFNNPAVALAQLNNPGGIGQINPGLGQFNNPNFGSQYNPGFGQYNPGLGGQFNPGFGGQYNPGFGIQSQFQNPLLNQGQYFGQYPNNQFGNQFINQNPLISNQLGANPLLQQQLLQQQLAGK